MTVTRFAFRLVLWLLFCICVRGMILAGAVNGLVFIAIAALVLLAWTFPRVRRAARSLTATDPTTQRSRLDDLDRPALGRDA